ncbi:hypothetical protein JL721_4235 [Aureococcus anophagefferens]|nr:hypothetical protein JL721_4235 [Aureococcus anophagefferens]
MLASHAIDGGAPDVAAVAHAPALGGARAARRDAGDAALGAGRGVRARRRATTGGPRTSAAIEAHFLKRLCLPGRFTARALGNALARRRAALAGALAPAGGDHAYARNAPSALARALAAAAAAADDLYGASPPPRARCWAPPRAARASLADASLAVARDLRVTAWLASDAPADGAAPRKARRVARRRRDDALADRREPALAGLLAPDGQLVEGGGPGNAFLDRHGDALDAAQPLGPDVEAAAVFALAGHAAAGAPGGEFATTVAPTPKSTGGAGAGAPRRARGVDARRPRRAVLEAALARDGVASNFGLCRAAAAPYLAAGGGLPKFLHDRMAGAGGPSFAGRGGDAPRLDACDAALESGDRGDLRACLRLLAARSARLARDDVVAAAAERGILA